MYVGVDVGGTKTLVAVLTDKGVIVESRKFPTPRNYHNFLLELRHCLAQFEHTDYLAGGVGIAVSRYNRDKGMAYVFGNLPWHDVQIQHDMEKVLKCPVVIENDAKMASLSEAMLLKGKYSRVLYVTISTGIGYGLTVDQKIDPNIGDAGGHAILLEHNGKLEKWESFASGKAIVERYGKRAQDIDDEATWKAIVRDLKLGFLELIAVMQPDVIVVGGGVGAYFERFQDLLITELKQYETPANPIPVIAKAQRPEEAVIYGCYDLAKAVFSTMPVVKKKAHAKAA